MTKAEQQKLWQSRITQYKASGQNVTAWCAEHDVNLVISEGILVRVCLACGSTYLLCTFAGKTKNTSRYYR